LSLTALERQVRRSRVARRELAPSLKQLAQVVVATMLVVGFPVATVWWARASGRVSSPGAGLVLGMIFSLGASSLGCLVWETLPGSEDLLFSELMIWGYLHRLRTQRRLSSALAMLGPIGDGISPDIAGCSSRQRVKLLEELVSEIETSDPYLHSHSRRVARHSWMIARRMGLASEDVARVRTAAAIHDVGKIRTPTAILHKPGRLTDEEYDVVKQHPVDGALMAELLRDASLASMVRYHHERLDGSGYPDALRGDEIPIGARIIAVADTFDAITSERPYRSASAHKRAIDILCAEAGTSLDEDVVHAFCGHYAGRTPIALSSFLTGLPERVVSWLSGSVGTVATAAKVATVAALVGGAAITSSVVASPAARHRTQATRSRASANDTPTVPTAPARASVRTHRNVDAVSEHPRSRGRTSSTTAIAAQTPTALPVADTPVSSGSTAAIVGSGPGSAGPASGASHQGATTVVATPPAAAGSNGKSEASTEAPGSAEATERNDELAAARATVEERRVKVEEGKASVGERGVKVEEAKASLGQRRTKVEEGRAAVTELRAEVTVAPASGKEHSVKLEEAVVRSEEHLVKLEEAVVGSEEHLLKLEEAVTKSEEHLVKLEVDLSKSEEGLTRLEADSTKAEKEAGKNGRGSS
jgi:HD-GYP domain-containing protein (c-di-GMP phosphodiesterase class II)